MKMGDVIEDEIFANKKQLDTHLQFAMVANGVRNGQLVVRIKKLMDVKQKTSEAIYKIR